MNKSRKKVFTVDSCSGVLLHRRAALLLVCVVALIFGCSAKKELRAMPGSMAMAEMEAANPEAGVESIGRMVAKTAYLNIEVDSLEDMEGRIKKVVADAGGLMTHSSFDGERYFRATLKVPSQDLDTVLDSIAALGDEEYRSIQTEDVTDSYIDTKARLDNLIALRTRLRKLLDKATEISDIVAIEAELARVQGEIDSLQGRLDALKDRTDYSTINLTVKMKRIYGPLGYLAKGLWWVISKLFVIK
jgi:hypothetical protein